MPTTIAVNDRVRLSNTVDDFENAEGVVLEWYTQLGNDEKIYVVRLDDTDMVEVVAYEISYVRKASGGVWQSPHF